jgi:Inositol phospholipid synthesis and fat-storage-inducing TM
MATNRKPITRSSTKSTTTDSTITNVPEKQTEIMYPAISPFLPTPLEAILICTYPLTLIAGSLFSQISPHIRQTTAVYSPAHQSFQPPHEAPSYFAQKKNIFNIYFVKIGWFWVTLSLALFIFTHPSFGAPFSPRLSTRRVRAALRWLAATGIWALTTQWFFGPALIDRSFLWTGGACQRIEAGEQMSSLREIWSHAQCRIAGGTWSGGIDISGHVFLLILGSGLLWMEVLPTVLRAQGLREARQVRTQTGEVVSAATESDKEREKEGGQVTSYGVKMVVAVVGLSWWMLLMTAAFFHTWSEKLSGLVVAFFGLWLVYFLPRGVPLIRSVLGMPGL